MQTKADRNKVPAFATEAEEAKWWDDHKEMVEENLIQAIRDRTTRRGSLAGKRAHRETSPCAWRKRIWILRANRRKRRDCHTRLISSRCCTKSS